MTYGKSRAGYLFTALLLLVCACNRQQHNKQVKGTGTIEGTEVRISSQVSGTVSAVSVRQGDKVGPGSPVARIDTSRIALQVEQAESVLEMAEAQLALLLKGVRKEDIEQAEQKLRQAQTRLTLAKDNFRRIANLFDQGSATMQQRDEAQTNLEVAEARHEETMALLKRLRKGARNEEIAAARAKVRQSEATLKLAQKSLADCTITSPCSGYVTQLLVEPGELARTGQGIVDITNLDPVYLVVYVRERDLGFIRLQQPADVQIDSFPGRRFNGRVVYISPEAEFTPKNIQLKEDRVKLVYGIKLEIANPKGVFKAGMPADAYIQKGTQP